MGELAREDTNSEKGIEDLQLLAAGLLAHHRKLEPDDPLKASWEMWGERLEAQLAALPRHEQAAVKERVIQLRVLQSKESREE